jgi:hypothetical protein
MSINSTQQMLMGMGGSKVANQADRAVERPVVPDNLIESCPNKPDMSELLGLCLTRNDRKDLTPSS